MLCDSFLINGIQIGGLSYPFSIRSIKPNTKRVGDGQVEVCQSNRGARVLKTATSDLLDHVSGLKTLLPGMKPSRGVSLRIWANNMELRILDQSSDSASQHMQVAGHFQTHCSTDSRTTAETSALCKFRYTDQRAYRSVYRLKMEPVG